jgi:hypothetical protein
MKWLHLSMDERGRGHQVLYALLYALPQKVVKGRSER